MCQDIDIYRNTLECINVYKNVKRCMVLERHRMKYRQTWRNTEAISSKLGLVAAMVQKIGPACLWTPFRIQLFCPCIPCRGWYEKYPSSLPGSPSSVMECSSAIPRHGAVSAVLFRRAHPYVFIIGFLSLVGWTGVGQHSAEKWLLKTWIKHEASSIEVTDSACLDSRDWAGGPVLLDWTSLSCCRDSWTIL